MSERRDQDFTVFEVCRPEYVAESAPAGRIPDDEEWTLLGCTAPVTPAEPRYFTCP